MPLVGLVFSTTAIQAVTSFSLTQLLSKAAQRMITELRQQVQQHVGRLAVSFYDANRTGLLVSRIMERCGRRAEPDRDGAGGVRRRHADGGTGLRLPGLQAAANDSDCLWCGWSFRRCFCKRRLRTIRPIFRERAKITGEVTGRLTESLGGVRVVKGYHAERREAQVFTVGFCDCWTT